ncbi:MAG: IS110 family transposase [Deltaproteobacteria bacterium]|nr:IS110 family transposase [Deltaproteobacteria bacterium]
MHYVGVDLHKHTLVIAVENAHGPIGRPVTIRCRETEKIVASFEGLRPFRAVIEASGSYRWLYDLLASRGEVVLAHPRRLKAIVEGRAKTDKRDAALLAKLLRVEMIPMAYVPPRRYQELRDLCRARARLARHATQAKNELHAVLTRRNIHPPFKTPFCRGWIRFVADLDLGFVGNATRDEALRRWDHYRREIETLDLALSKAAASFPEVPAIMEIPGIGLFSALLIIGELGEPLRFHDARQVGAYSGLTPRVDQSGGHCHHGSITRQGSPWLRWVLVQAAMKAPQKDKALANFYTRVRNGRARRSRASPWRGNWRKSAGFACAAITG